MVKCIDPVTRLEVDVCVNNDTPLANTELLRTYAAIDARFGQLTVLVKGL